MTNVKWLCSNYRIRAVVLTNLRQQCKDDRVHFQPEENEDAGVTEIVPGVQLWNEVLVHAWDYHGMDVDVLVRLADDRLTADVVTVRRRDGGDPVTADALRSIAVTQFIRRSLEAHARAGGDPFVTLTGEPRVAFDFLAEKDRDRMVEAGPVTETLRMVAALYRIALAIGDRPTKTVTEVFQVPRYTADRWVAKARERGFLGPAEGPGKAGA